VSGRLQRPDLRLVQCQTGPDWVLDLVCLLQPMTPRGKAWLDAHADGRQWVEAHVDGRGRINGMVIDRGPDSLLVAASKAGLGVTGCGPVCGDMLHDLREHCAPDLTLTQLAARLGFTVRQWKLMEADERMVPEPDDFWDRAMELVGELDQERERHADAAELN
jgi:Helix-turn-helix domain